MRIGNGQNEQGVPFGTGVDEKDSWYDAGLIESGVLSFDINNGGLQKCTLTTDVTQTTFPISLDEENQTFLVQVNTAGHKLTIGFFELTETMLYDVIQLGFYWDGTTTRMYPPVQVMSIGDLT